MDCFRTCPMALKKPLFHGKCCLFRKDKINGIKRTFRLKEDSDFNASIDRNPDGGRYFKNLIFLWDIIAEKPVGFDFDLSYKITAFCF
jgi:hypothetical protein